MIYCLKCNALLDTASLNVPLFVKCHNCSAPNQSWIFPCAVTDAPGRAAPENLFIRDDAGCFYHPSKQAAASCDACGRFLCALCDIEMEGKHICFNCMAAGKEKKTMKNLENHRVLYDALAIRLAVFPVLIFWFLTFISAPVTLFISIRHWNSPSSIVPRKKKLRFVIAILLSLIQIIGWGVLIFYLIENNRW